MLSKNLQLFIVVRADARDVAASCHAAVPMFANGVQGAPPGYAAVGSCRLGSAATLKGSGAGRAGDR